MKKPPCDTRNPNSPYTDFVPAALALLDFEQVHDAAKTKAQERAQKSPKTIAQRAAAREVVLTGHLRLWESRYKSFHDIVARQYPKLARAFRARDKALTRQFMQGPRDETAFQSLLDGYQRLAQEGLQKGRQERDRTPDAIIARRYDLILDRLTGRAPKYHEAGKPTDLPEQGDPYRTEFLMDALASIHHKVPDKVFQECATLRRREEIARKLVCAMFPDVRPSMVPKILSRAKRSLSVKKPARPRSLTSKS